MTAAGTRQAESAEEKGLVQRARGGDVAAFADLVKRYQRPLWRFLTTWVPDPQEREEVVQEVFLAAYRGIRKFRGQARFSTWLLQIAINRARGQRRRLARRPKLVPLRQPGKGEDPLDEGPAGWPSGSTGNQASPEEVVSRRQVYRRIWELVERLPEGWQAVMRLRYLEEMTHPEIAEVLGVPVGTVKAQLHRGRQRLAAWLEKEGIA
ncbi:MAG: RNA polymerase sigma factor [Acidobacteriota bacterium]